MEEKKLVSRSLSNRGGRLYINEWDAAELAQCYGTPLYVMDEDLIRESCQAYQRSLDENYNGNGLICYASKAFCCKQIYRIVREEGLGADCVSLGELYTAEAVGFDPELICYHGNNKTKKELTAALEYGVGRIVVDNLSELMLLDQLAGAHGVKQKILLRITPGISAHTHAFIQTGQNDSKFGFAIEGGFALEAARLAAACGNLDFAGLHCHIGSQIFDAEPFEAAAKVMVDFMALCKQECGVTLRECDLGGGFGIPYLAADDPVDYSAYMRRVAAVMKEEAAKSGLPLPFVILEPGRSIVGSAGTTLYEVGNVKTVPGGKQYAAVDGGMTDNIRPALYEAEYTFYAAEKMDEPCDTAYTIAGRCCESGDILGAQIMLPKLESGDILAVAATGAYCFAMSGNYNRLPRPGVLFVREGEMYMGVSPQTFEELMQDDI